MLQSGSLFHERLSPKWLTFILAFTLERAQKDFNREKLMQMSNIELASHLKKILGEDVTTRVFNELAEERKNSQNQGLLKVDPKRGMLSAAGSIAVTESHHYGR